MSTTHSIVNQDTGYIPRLLLLALVLELLAPLLVWNMGFPSQLHWASHAAIALMIAGVYVQVTMRRLHVPLAIWVIIPVSTLGVISATSHGQGFLATAWGWWNLFQFPMLAIYVYLHRKWSEDIIERFYKFCIILLLVQVLIQIAQYAMGESPGDDLAGLFGYHGTGKLVIFLFIVLSFALGHWLFRGNWKSVVMVLGLGAVSSALGEIKAFVPGSLALIVMALVLSIVTQGRKTRIVPMAIACALMIFFSLFLYDRVMLGDRPRRGQSIMEFLDKERLNRYIGRNVTDNRGDTQLGRMYSMQYGWDSIRHDSYTMFLGFGLGSRSESKSLGTGGIVLERERYSTKTTGSLLRIMQEMGVVGLLIMAGFALWVVRTMWRDIRRYPHSKATQLRYALLLFSVLWPLWLWYSEPWRARVAMMLYWSALAFVLSDFTKSKTTEDQDCSGIESLI